MLLVTGSTVLLICKIGVNLIENEVAMLFTSFSPLYIISLWELLAARVEAILHQKHMLTFLPPPPPPGIAKIGWHLSYSCLNCGQTDRQTLEDRAGSGKLTGHQAMPLLNNESLDSGAEIRTCPMIRNLLSNVSIYSGFEIRTCPTVRYLLSNVS